MPQMFPLLWAPLYLYFITIFIIYIIMNFYIFNNNSVKNYNNKNINIMSNISKW
nr:ATP synthase F0 subunit 8 [Fenusa (Kaliofenusa) sp. 2 GYN-2022b]